MTSNYLELHIYNTAQMCPICEPRVCMFQLQSAAQSAAAMFRNDVGSWELYCKIRALPVTGSGGL
jgi:hypothetical protein